MFKGPGIWKGIPIPFKLVLYPQLFSGTVIILMERLILW